MSEETEMDLESAIGADMHNISQAMKDFTPLGLAKYAHRATDPKVCGIRDRVLAGQSISGKQYAVLAEHFLYEAECAEEDGQLEYGQTVWGDYDRG